MLLEKSVPIYQILKRYTQNKKRLLVFQSDGVLVTHAALNTFKCCSLHGLS
jgi:hypothetical protein